MVKRGFVALPGRGEHKIHMVHVVDVASLLLRIAELRASGHFNAAVPEPRSIRQWVDEIGDAMGIRRVIKLPIPLLPVKWLSRLFRYRILAWQPVFSNARVVRDIAA